MSASPGAPLGEHAAGTLAERIRAHVEQLCAAGDREPGTDRNRRAAEYAASVMEDIGLQVERLPFEVPEWERGAASATAGGSRWAMHPGPFSSSVDAEGPLVVISRPTDLDGLCAEGCVLLLHGDIARIQLTPRGYPFYQDAAHAAILDALEATGAAAVLAATDKNPSMTAGQSPFPLIEEPGFALPTAYLHSSEGAELAVRAGERVRVRIESGTRPSTGIQPVGTRPASGETRIVIGAHVDTKPGTPGAIDNASGVAVMLAAAELLAHTALRVELEFVPFNGEDHVLAPGEVAYLRTRDASGVELTVNIDGVGLSGSPSEYSDYNADESLVGLLDRHAAGNPSMIAGEPWPASDHMIFAMQGVPSVAITSHDFATASGVYAHTPLDTPDLLDYTLLSDTARFVADIVEAVAGPDRPS